MISSDNVILNWGGERMPEFTNPFAGKVPERKLTAEELIRAIRLDLAAEEEAIHLYMAQADAAKHPLAQKVLIDVANEERQHAGEFLRLLQILTGDEDKWLADGAGEVDEMAAEVTVPEQEEAAPSSGEEPTIGSLKE
jgi:rubrerythrin